MRREHVYIDGKIVDSLKNVYEIFVDIVKKIDFSSKIHILQISFDDSRLSIFDYHRAHQILLTKSDSSDDNIIQLEFNRVSSVGSDISFSDEEYIKK
jgi:hypothetical protein